MSVTGHTPARSRSLRVILSVAWGLLAGACSQPELERQPKIDIYEESDSFSDGRSAQPEVVGTVARGDLRWERQVAESPEVNTALLERGRLRYEQVCLPCHGFLGDGNGMVVQRGFPAPPDYGLPRLRSSSEAYFVQVITQGYGVMYSYASRVEPADRWAIAYYIRALQEATTASIDDVPSEILKEWTAGADADHSAATGVTP